MQITIKGKNLEVTENLESFIQKKIGGLRKFLKAFEGHSLPVAGERGLFDTFIEVKKETMHHRKGDIFRAEGKIYAPGTSIFAKAHGEDVIKVIGELRDELENEIRRYKTKTVEFPRRQAKKANNNF